MRYPVQKLIKVAVLMAGLTLLVWGRHAFNQPKPPSPPDEEAHRMCLPTLGEILELDLIGCKIGWLTVSIIGLGLAGGSALSLMRREHR